MGIEQFLKKQYPSEPHFSPEEKAKLHSNFVQKVNDMMWTKKEHPNRNGNHTHFVDISQTLAGIYRRKGPTGSPSTGFEHWQTGDEDHLALGHYLEASPGITKGIKEVAVSFFDHNEDLDDTSDESVQGTQAMYFQTIMELVSQKLNLEYFTLKNGGPKISIATLASEEGPIKVLIETRALIVAKGFRVDINSLLKEGYAGKEHERRYAEFMVQWEPKLRAALLPDVLRPQTPETDEIITLRLEQKNKIPILRLICGWKRTRPLGPLHRTS